MAGMTGMYVGPDFVRPLNEQELKEAAWRREMAAQQYAQAQTNCGTQPASIDVQPITVSLDRLTNVSEHLANCIRRLENFTDRAVGGSEIMESKFGNGGYCGDSPVVSLAHSLERLVDHVARQVAELDRQVDRTGRIA